MALMTEPTRPQKITFAEMREQGVRGTWPSAPTITVTR
jgi:hypothetical protein